MLIKKRLLPLLLILLAPLANHARAALTIEITGGIEGALPIAVVPFDMSRLSSKLPIDIAQIVASDLDRSGVLKSMDRGALPASPHYSNQVRYAQWKTAGQDYLVVGRVLEKSPGVYDIQFQLLDVLKQKQLIGRSMSAKKRNLRSRAHQISDFIYEQITGTRGAFNTRIAYVRAQADAARKYVLQVADTDGFNAQNVLESDEPIMSPSWSPDGKFLALVLSKDGNPDVYTLNTATKRLKRVTNHRAIDTEPVWMPDGRSIVFTSDRAGSPQLYQVDIDGGRARRLTFEGRYNSAASLSPDGKYVALVHGDRGQYKIAQLEIETGNLTVLTDSTLDESPSFSPNGKMVLYASTEGNSGILYAISIDGRARRKLSDQAGDIREPVWGPFESK